MACKALGGLYGPGGPFRAQKSFTSSGFHGFTYSRFLDRHCCLSNCTCQSQGGTEASIVLIRKGMQGFRFLNSRGSEQTKTSTEGWLSCEAKTSSIVFGLATLKGLTSLQGPISLSRAESPLSSSQPIWWPQGPPGISWT